MARKAVPWIAATRCAMTVAVAVPQAGGRGGQAPAATPAASAVKADSRVAALKQQVVNDAGSPACTTSAR